MQDLDFSSFFKVSHILTASTLIVFVVVFIILILHNIHRLRQTLVLILALCTAANLTSACGETSKLEIHERCKYTYGKISEKGFFFFL